MEIQKKRIEIATFDDNNITISNNNNFTFTDPTVAVKDVIDDFYDMIERFKHKRSIKVLLWKSKGRIGNRKRY